ncbi:hypothetical protein [Saccharothrix sp.]|uniref:hypothetical protein n=1 Tax=Saccharothrix sp. TaxID=1873460 RepID=UPI002811900E|nr:hypothetical protein [Saccharothrix sp.]
MTEFDPARQPDEVVDTGALPPVEVDLEEPDADAVEQARAAQDEQPEAPPGEIPLDADPADVVEQHRELGIDDEDYR